MKYAFFKYITALLLFGTNGIVASYIHLNSYEIVFLRTMLGSLLLISVFFLGKNKLTFHMHGKQFLFLCLSGIAMGASWMLLYEAYSQIGVSIASLLYYCGPVIVMALSPFLFGERLTVTKLLGFAAVLAGIVFVNGDTFDGGNITGFLCGILSALMYAVMVICNKKASGIVGLENSMLQLIISFLTVAVYLLFRQNTAYSVQPTDWVPILLLGFLNTGIGCYLYFSSIGKLSVQTVAICGYLEPLSAVLFSVIILQEAMTLPQVIGALFIIGGAVLAEFHAAK